MLDPNRAEIDALKARWRQLLTAHRQQEKLIQMLEEVESLLLKLEGELTKTPQPENQPHIEEKQQLYHQLSQKKHELDSLLDKVEGIASGDMDLVQDELIKRLIEYKPELAQAYGTLHQKLLKTFKKMQTYQLLSIGLDKIHSHINTLLEVRQQAKGWGFWRHLFRPSPTDKISYEIEKLHEAVTALLQRGQHSEEITLLLKQLNSLSKQRWNYTIIDRHYAPLLDSILLMHEQCFHALVVARKEKANIREQIIDWIDSA